jgi:hypothetical protein
VGFTIGTFGFEYRPTNRKRPFLVGLTDDANWIESRTWITLDS